MRKALVLTTVVAAGLVGALTGPASAGTTTTTTFTLTAGSGLSVSVPDTASNIGSAAAGSTTVSGSLGPITVTDPRGALAATWTATVSSTDFTTGTTPTANETVAKANITYSSGAGTAAAGQVGAMVPSIVGVSLASSATAATWAGVGNNTVTWTPTLSFSLLASQVAGTYTGTVTHSVS
jgi:hypothetical protein